MNQFQLTFLLILLSLILYGQPEREYNPHHGLESRFITSWDHSNSTRYEIPQRYLSTVNAIQWSAVTVKNLDRPISSHVLPLIVDVRTEDPKLRFKILEDYVYQYRPVSPVNPRIRRRYGIAKSFNGRDITQWEVHLPTTYINELDTEGKIKNVTEFKEEATKYYIKDIDSEGKPNVFTLNENEKATLYKKQNGRFTKNRAEAINNTPIENKPEVVIERNEDYVVLANFRGRQGVHFFTKYSQVAGVSFARLHFNGAGDAEFFKIKNDRNVNVFSIRSWRENKNINYFDLSTDILKIDGNKSWLRVRDENDNAGIFRYVKLYQEGELLNSQTTNTSAPNIRTNKKGKKFTEIFHEGKIYYAPLMTPKEAGF